MKSPDETVPETSPPTDNIHHDKGNEMSVKNMTTKPTTQIPNLKLSQKKSPPQQQNTESDTNTTTYVTLKILFYMGEVLTPIRERSISQMQSCSTTT